MSHRLHGWRFQVSAVVPATLAHAWTTVSDLATIPRFSPEVQEFSWVAPAVGPAAGAQFTAVNSYASRRWEVRGRVIETVPEARLNYEVLDDTNTASTTWMLNLGEATDRRSSYLSYTVLHGPGRSLLVDLVEQDPATADQIIEARHAAMVDSIRQTWHRMFGGLDTFQPATQK